MSWVLAALLVLVLGAVAVLAAGPAGTLVAPERDVPEPRWGADGAITAEQLRAVRFPLALRGYRMSDVDALLDQLAGQLGGAPTAPDAATNGPSAAESRGDFPH